MTLDLETSFRLGTRKRERYWYGPHPFSQGDALEILRCRYAAGEIDGPTYDQMRERLEGSGH